MREALLRRENLVFDNGSDQVGMRAENVESSYHGVEGETERNGKS